MKRSLFALVCMVLFSFTNTFAESGKIYFDIPSQEVKTALDTFLELTDISMVSSAGNLGILKSQSVTGKFTPDQALEIMLEGTGLVYEKRSENTVSIRKDYRQVQVESQAKADSKPAGANDHNPVVAENSGSDSEQAPKEPAQVAGQVQEKSEPGESYEDYLLEETMVTAQKREQEIMNVPMAISAVTGEDITISGAVDLNSLKAMVPSLSMSPDGSRIYIRGISPPGENMPTTGRYADEMSLNADSMGFAIDFPLVDIARVEILRGPQGTLYGEGSMGGAIRYITKSPKFGETDGVIEVSGRSVDGGSQGYRAMVAANVPFSSETFGVRLAAYSEQAPGWIDSKFWGSNANKEERWLVRGKVLWEPTESFSASLMVQHFEMERDMWDSYGYVLSDTNFYSNQYTSVPREREYDLFNLIINWDLGPVNITSSTALVDRGNVYMTSLNYLPYVEFYFPGSTVLAPLFGNPFTVVNPVSDMDFVFACPVIDSFAQEIRLSGDVGEKLYWTAGGYYKSLELEMFYATHYYPDNNAIPVAVGDGFAFRDTEAWAMFGEVSYNITSAWEVTAGLRYYEDTREAHNNLIMFGWPQTLIEEVDNDSLVTRFVLKYQVNDNLMAYGSFSEGFRSGGIQTSDQSAFGLSNTFAPEELTSYEIGAKGALANGRVEFNIAAFFTEYEDIQVYIPNPFGTQAYANSGGAEVLGFELASTIRATDSLSFNLSYAHNDSEYTDGGLVHNAGDPMDNVPENTFSLSADYRFYWWGDVGGHLHVDYFYLGEESYILRNMGYLPEGYVSDEEISLNVRLGWDFGVWNIYLFAENITNNDAQIAKPAVGRELPTIQRPLTFGASFRMSF